MGPHHADDVNLSQAYTLIRAVTVCDLWHGDIASAEKSGNVWRGVAAVAAVHVCDVFMEGWMDIALGCGLRSARRLRLRRPDAHI